MSGADEPADEPRTKGGEPGPEDAAEEVRAWLVQLRGGAPFLSSADGELLSTWLEAGVPVVTILRGLEAVGERRRAKRTRTPFTLRSCKATVERLAGRKSAWRVPVDLAAALAPEVVAPVDPVAALLAELRALEGSAEARADRACVLLRQFHQQVWDGLGDERNALITAAEEELAPLREALGAEAFRRACEEHARDRVRTRYPTLTVARVWEEFGLGLA